MTSDSIVVRSMCDSCGKKVLCLVCYHMGSKIHLCKDCIDRLKTSYGLAARELMITKDKL